MKSKKGGGKKAVPVKGTSPSVGKEGKVFKGSTGATGYAKPYGLDKTHKKKYQ